MVQLPQFFAQLKEPSHPVRHLKANSFGRRQSGDLNGDLCGGEAVINRSLNPLMSLIVELTRFEQSHQCPVTVDS